MNARALAAALLALTLLMAKCTYDERRRAEGIDRAWLAQVAAERDTVRLLRDSLAKAFRVQVETVRVATVRRIPVRDTVERWLRDTVPVPVEIVRELVRVDSVLIQACSVALNTCGAEKAALLTDLSLAEKQRDYWQRRAAPSLLTRLSTAAKWLAIGYATAAITRRD